MTKDIGHSTDIQCLKGCRNGASEVRDTDEDIAMADLKHIKRDHPTFDVTYSAKLSNS